ncbi:hypothetical protein GYH30_012866 [Glycine max]|nr:hypothetical protein GYH30_012866 [Glycine max]
MAFFIPTSSAHVFCSKVILGARAYSFLSKDLVQFMPGVFL